ncbi:hypothetical protein [Xanthobacter autotrophicus]|uniref:hypothetical protein n=1 Tax=Xanthobacter autotrophicus TaxID=280 RepID=UPI0037299961
MTDAAIVKLWAGMKEIGDGGLSAMIFFHDLPIYRLSPDAFEAENQRSIDQCIANSFGSWDVPQEHIDRSRRILTVSAIQRGGAWEFNEVVGFLRLHFVGSQIRGEYVGTDRKRIYRTRRKVFHFKTWKLAPEVEIADTNDDQSIYRSVTAYVDRCRRELPLRYFDDRWLREVGPFLNWKALRQAGR